MCLTPLVDGVAKGMGAETPPLTVAFLRYAAAGLVGCALLFVMRRPLVVPRDEWLSQIIRTALLMGAMTCLISALAVAPMAVAVSGFFIAPLTSSVLGALCLNERMSGRRAGGVILGFAGALAVLQPAGGQIEGAAFAAFAGLLFGVYLTVTRSASDRGCDLSSLVVQCLLGATLLAPFAMYSSGLAIDGAMATGALAMGAISASCHLLTLHAYRLSEASELSPFLYFNLIAATVAGYVWFGETPNTLAMMGMAGIFASGALIAAGEREQARGAAA